MNVPMQETIQSEPRGQILTKVCRVCEKSKLMSEFGVRQLRCRICTYNSLKEDRKKHPKRHAAYRRKHHLKQFFNMTEEAYEELLIKQGGVCAICKTDDPGNRHKTKNLNVDHDHSSGKIRGLLCTSCNHALGKFKDDPLIIEAAVEYLRKNNV